MGQQQNLAALKYLHESSRSVDPSWAKMSKEIGLLGHITRLAGTIWACSDIFPHYSILIKANIFFKTGQLKCVKIIKSHGMRIYLAVKKCTYSIKARVFGYNFQGCSKSNLLTNVKNYIYFTLVEKKMRKCILQSFLRWAQSLRHRYFDLSQFFKPTSSLCRETYLFYFQEEICKLAQV